MKRFFTNKKSMQVLSAVLVLCLALGVVGVYPLEAQGGVSADSLISFGSFEVEDTDKGAKVTHTAEGENWERVFHTTQYDAQAGIHMEIADITTTASNYSFVVTWGGDWTHWSHQAGYMLVYGSNGHLEIFPTKTNDSGDAVPGTGGTELVNVDREALSGNFAMDIQLVEGSYVITVNGDTYTIPTVNPYGSVDSGTQMSIEKAKGLYFSFDIKGGINEETDNVDLEQKIPSGSSFVVSDISNNYQAPMIAKAEGTDTVANLTPSDMVLMAAENYMTVQNENGVKVSYDSAIQGWGRICTNNPYNAETGIHVEVKDIAAEGNHSFVMSIGNVWAAQWSDQKGYIIVYDNAGNFAIHGMKGTQWSEIDKTLVSIKREALGNSLTMDIKLQDNDYVLTVNGKTYTIPAQNSEYPLGNLTELYVAMGLFGAQANAGVIPGDSITNAGFTITKVCNWVPQDNDDDGGDDGGDEGDEGGSGSGDEDDDYVITSVPEGIVRIGDHFEFQETNEGLVATHHAKAAAWERFWFVDPEWIDTDGIQLDIENITSENDNYSLAVGLSSGQNYWYDQKGIMILYSKSGNLAIIGTTGETVDPNEAEVLSSGNVTYKDTLSINTKQQGDNYVLTINGTEYTIDGEWLSDSSAIYYAFGVMSDYKLVDGDVSELQYHQDDFKNVNVSFTVVRETSDSGDDGNSGNDDGDDDDYVITSVPEGVVRIGDHFEFQKTNEGLIATHHAKAAAWERFWFVDPEWVDEDGLQLDIKNITSESDNYSLAVGLSSGQNYWYDQKGIMILYSKSGNLAIIGTTSETLDPNEAEVLASGNVTYKDTLSINTKKQGDKYVLIINETAYTIDGKWLGNADAIYYAFGVMSDYKLANGDVSELQYHQNDFKTANVSFKIMGMKNAATEDGVREETPNGYVVNPEDVEMAAVGDNIVLHKQNNGIKIIHTAKAAGWERVGYTKTFDVSGNGMHIQIEEITSKASDYTVAIAIGNALNQWGDQTGYMILYGKNGEFSIIATDPSITDFNQSPVVVSGKREVLGDSLSVDVKLKNDNYIITVNGIVYTIPARHGKFPLTDVKGLYVSFGIVGGGKIGDIDFVSNNFKRNYVSFVLTEVTDEIDLGRDFGLHVTGYNWELTKTSRGTKITNGVDGAGWERISTKQGYLTTGDGVSIELVDIESRDPNYSIAVMLGNGEDVWYDCRGYMIIYGKSGNFSIVANDVSIINPNKSPVVVSEVREELGSTLSINVKLVDEDYEITVNGKTYTLPAQHSKWPVDDVKWLFASFGVMSDGEIGEVIYNTPFKKSPVSFTLASITGSDEDVTQEKPIEEKDEPVSAEKDEKPIEEVAEQENTNVLAIVSVIVVALILVAGLAGFIIWDRKRKAKEEQHEKDL